MRRPELAQVADGALVVLVLSPWIVAAVQRRRAVSAPVAAEFWYLWAGVARASARALGELALSAEARYWEVVRHGH